MRKEIRGHPRVIIEKRFRGVKPATRPVAMGESPAGRSAGELPSRLAWRLHFMQVLLEIVDLSLNILRLVVSRPVFPLLLEPPDESVRSGRNHQESDQRDHTTA